MLHGPEEQEYSGTIVRKFGQRFVSTDRYGEFNWSLVKLWRHLDAH